MVFESLVVDIINKYLGNYVTKLDKSQLKIGLLGGNATLENLDIKENAFEEFDLPVKVVQGHIGKLTMKIPWKHLYSEPVVAELDGLYVLVMPNSGVQYNEEKERLFKLEVKLKALNRIEEAKAKGDEPKKESDHKDSFSEKLAAQIIKNLQINISNIHIRYEDSFTNPQRPFAVGITLYSLSFQTCDAKGDNIVIKDDSTREFFKSVKMDSLALYWKSKPTFFNELPRGQMQNAMKGTISSGDNKVVEINFLLQPISCSAMMHVHMRPETTAFSVPQLSLHLSIDQMGFAFTRNQYYDLATFLDSIDRVWTQNRFLKYRPKVPLKGNIKTWWLFPYTVILEEQVRRRRRMWQWQYIHYHRTQCTTYSNLWERKLVEKKLNSDDQKTLENCEEELDLLNITLCRQQAEMKNKKLKRKLKEQKFSTGGWFSGWFGKVDLESTSSQMSEETEEIERKVHNEFTHEEKAKLYQAIGYSEHSKDPDIPKEYVSLKLNILLHKFAFIISDESMSEKKLMKLSIHSLSTNIQQRSSANALKVSLIMSTMQLTGSMHSDGVVPVIVSTQRVSQVDNLLIAEFETNPLDESAHQKVNIRAEPLEIIYDSNTINRLVKFVTPPEELRLHDQRLSSEVAASLEDVREMSATGLLYLVEQRLYTDIKADIKPSYFILPENGSYKKDCKMLLVDFGSITVRSERLSTLNSGTKNQLTAEGKLDYEMIKETAYDKFRITISKMQLMLVEQGDDWRNLRSKDTSKCHIIRPFGFDFHLKKCVISNDINLPNIFIEGCLPSLVVVIGDRALQSLLELILHIPFPKTEPPNKLSVKEQIIKTIEVKPVVDILKTTKHGKHKKQSRSTKVEKNSKNSNLVNVDLVFVITSVEIQVYEMSSYSVERKEIIKLNVEDIGLSLTLKRFDMNVQAYIGSLLLLVPQFKQQNTRLPVSLLQTSKRAKHQNLLFVKLMVVQKSAPDFIKTYRNTRHTLEFNFKALEVCLHQESILLVLTFANSLSQMINIEEKESPVQWSKVVADNECTLKEEERDEDYVNDEKLSYPATTILDTVMEHLDSNKEKRSIRLSAQNEAERVAVPILIPETVLIQWAVTATLEKLRISFASEKYCDIFEISIHGMRADVKMTYIAIEVALSVTDLRIQDPSANAMYKKIMWIDPDESVFSTQVVIFSQSTRTPGFELDLSRVDTIFNLEIGKVKIIFLYHFVHRIQGFLDNFQSALQSVIDKAKKLSDVASNKVSEAIEESASSRLSLNIQIHAPVIYIPECSKSTNALMLDLGSFIFQNNFKIAPNTEAVIEVSTISLTNIRISRGKFLEKMVRIGDKRGYLLRYNNKSILLENTIESEKGVLKPININVDMVRNLSWPAFDHIPQIDVNAKIHSIGVTMTQGDYSMVQTVLQSNFGEIITEDVVPDVVVHASSISRQATNNDRALVIKERMSEVPHVELTTVQFAFQMDYLDIELFKGDLSPSEWNYDVPADRRMAKMTCDNLLVKGKIYQSTAMDVDVKLHNINLLDTQPGSATKINQGIVLRLIKNRSNESKDFISIRFKQDNLSNCKLSIDIAGIFVCLCMDYLILLTDFLVKAQPPPPPPIKKQMVAVRGHDENPRKFRKRPLKQSIEPKTEDFEINVRMERPEILLVEDINNNESNAIMIQMELTFKYALLRECDIINADVNGFEVTFCPFNIQKRKKYSMDIVSPTSVTFYCKRPNNQGMQGSLTMEHLVINITPALIQSLSKIMENLKEPLVKKAKIEKVASNEKLSVINFDRHDYTDFWEMKEFEDSEFTFISKGMMEKNKIDDVEANVESGFDVAQMLLDVEQRRADQGLNVIIYIRLPDIRVVLESEMAKKCVPMLILECSVDGDMKNPLTQISIGLTVSLSMSYFNDHINIWEPLIEIYLEENKRQYCFEVEYITCDNTPLFSEEDYEDLASVEPSAVSILLLSRDNLELTLSKTALNVLSHLGKAFEDAYSTNIEDHKAVVGAPYVIKNTLGIDIMLYLNDDFDLMACNADYEQKVLLRKDAEIQLCDAKIERQTLITEEKTTRLIQISWPDTPAYKESLYIYKSEIRGLYLDYKETTNKPSSLSERDLSIVVVETTAYLGMKNLELRSILQVFNNCEESLNLYYKPKTQAGPGGMKYVLIETIDSGICFNVPIPVLIGSDCHMYISAPTLDTDVSLNGALWKISRSAHIPASQILECSTESGCVYYFSVNIEETTIRYSSNISDDDVMNIYKIRICAPLSFHNQLPIQIGYQSQTINVKVQRGSKHYLKTASLEKQSTIKITYEYHMKDWFGVLELKPKMDELGIITFKSREGFTEMSMDLGIHVIAKGGQFSITIYSPYWMINKTGHKLVYKAGDDDIIHHNPEELEVVLFSFLSKSIFNKKKVNLKIADSSWSDKFSLDTVGSNGKIICKKKTVSYEIGVKINLSSCGLTKIVTFMPYYMIINQSVINIFCNELVEGAGWISVPPKQAVPFWPRSEVGKSMLMRCKVEDREVLVTQPFPFFESHSILMKLEKKYVGIFVEVQITEEANLITLHLYQEGMALVQLVNHLEDSVEIYYKQSGCNQELTLLPFNTVMYAWQDSRQKKELIWRVEGGNKKQNVNNLTSDGIEDFYIDDAKAYWVSFVMDMHRILLFTSDIHVAKHARLSTDLENIDMEVTISLHSIGLSLIDNEALQELAYISITSSGIKWNQVRGKNRHRPLKVSQSEALEVAYDEYVNKLRTGEMEIEQHIVKVLDLEVDLSKKLMIRPEKCELTRVFEPGVYLQYRTSPHQMHIHLRIYRIQVDNQMDDCIFPVVFSPYPTPRSVTLDNGLKPLFEMSAVIGKTSDAGSMRFKYFRVLIQEMQLMLDQGFVNAMLDYLSGTVPDFVEEDMFKNDYIMIQNCLIDTPTINAILQGGKKCVFDNFHISPVKIHLSFSLSRVSRTGKTALHSEVFNLFLQSVGIAITDMQDVIFKLGYFEKQNSIMPMNQMIGAMTRHYLSQGLRQMYVLVLGLDVLGNPFGVIRGMAQGVEDLFYEPMRGAILGPEEFAEGVAYGVKSLFGHAVGGAAGAVSRIVGTMGKGIAALTLDADYQRKRREQLARRPDNLGVGLAQGGKDLIVGIVQGVTGVITKPIEGAKKDGVEGFFIGVGKGLVGVVTRPVSGVVDFASSSFEGIRRVADTNVDVYRIRPPRFISRDGVVRSYGLREAEGNTIWKKVTEKSESLPNEVYVFHIYCKSQKQVLFLSNLRILHLDRNDILGTWSIDWQITYDKLDGTPTINENKGAIVFTLKERQRKVFSKDNTTKEIAADVPSLKVVIAKVMNVAGGQKSFSS